VRAFVDPLRELHRGEGGKERGQDRPWRFDGLLIATLTSVGAIATALLGGIPLLPALLSAAAGIASALGISMILEHRKMMKGHIRFVPVRLVRRLEGWIPASRAAVPFAAAALISFVFLAPGTDPGGRAQLPSTVPSVQATMDAYVAHMEFQRDFSITRLGSSSSPPYERYDVELDGLISSGSESGGAPDIGKLELPPAERMLLRAAPAVKSLGLPDRPMVGTILAVASAVAAALPTLVYALRARARIRGIESFMDKRIAA
jgi:hypothetical protein